ncbi:hypothetical protein ACA910_000120 [Epithemia clementina (nom. ined.)]
MQFGHTLDCLLHRIHNADPRHGPVFMLKINLADGFYRAPLCPPDVPRLGVTFPRPPSSPHDLIAFPITLPMGWTESPPHFSSFTETITDLANTWAGHWRGHPLEYLASSTPTPQLDRTVIYAPSTPAVPRQPISLPTSSLSLLSHHRCRPLAYTDVDIDDEIMVAQGTVARLNRLRRVLMHCNDMVFRSNDDDNAHTDRREPMSVKNFYAVTLVGQRSKPCWDGTSTLSVAPSNFHLIDNNDYWNYWTPQSPNP